jgi:hypothetical protein
MKMLKQHQAARRMRPGLARRAVIPGANLCLWAGRGVTACALVTLCLSPAWAADVLPVKEPGPQATLAGTPAYTPQGRQMERYKDFARQAELPAITVTNKTTLEIGGAVRLDLNRLAQLSAQEQATLAERFGVPAGVISKLTERAASQPPPNAAQLAQELRTAVIDYRFLQGEWKRYHPSAEGQKLKAEALVSLQTGDIAKAWQLYDGLQSPQAPSLARPQPPSDLRLVSHQ